MHANTVVKPGAQQQFVPVQKNSTGIIQLCYLLQEKGSRHGSEGQLTNVEGPGSNGSRWKGFQIGRVGLGPQLAHQRGQCFNRLRAVLLTVHLQSLLLTT